MTGSKDIYNGTKTFKSADVEYSVQAIPLQRVTGYGNSRFWGDILSWIKSEIRLYSDRIKPAVWNTA